MSFTTVLRDDLTNTRRSYVVLGVVAVLTGLVSLIVYSVADFHADAYRALYDVAFFFFLVLPLVLVPLTYLSIAGDRERGAIKHTLGLPNTRAEYVFGKYVSRTVVALGAVLLSSVAALLVGVGMYDTAIALERFVVFALVSTLFVASMTAIFVACSTVTGRRSRAMIGVIAAYFVLGPFWYGVLPVVNLENVLTTVADLFGTSLSTATTTDIRYLSPTSAYLSGLEPAFVGDLGSERYPRLYYNYIDTVDDTDPWYNYLVMTAWGVLALGVSYARFRVAELG